MYLVTVRSCGRPHLRTIFSHSHFPSLLRTFLPLKSLNPTTPHTAPERKLSFNERLEKSITYILDSAEATITTESEDTTLRERLSAFRLLSVVTVPVYRLVRRASLAPQQDPELTQALSRFRERLEETIASFLERSELLISGKYGTLTIDQRLNALRYMARVAVPVYRMTTSNHIPHAQKRSGKPAPAFRSNDYYTQLMDELCMKDDFINAPNLDPRIREKLLKVREEKIRQMELVKSGYMPPPQYRPAPLYHKGRIITPTQPAPSASTPKPAPAPMQAPAPVQTPVHTPIQSEPQYSKPLNPPHRYKLAQSEPTPDQRDLIRFNILKTPELVTPPPD